MCFFWGRNMQSIAESLVSTGVGKAREWLTIILVILLLKLIIVAIDPDFRVFMGDSASYLHAALSEWNPPDRSITYPWLVSIATSAHSGLVMVLLQTALGIGSCLLSYWILRFGSSVPTLWAGLTASLIALEPAQLFYERMLMAEAAGFFMLMLMLSTGVAYVTRGGLRWLPLIAASGLAAVSLRMSLLPVVFGLTFILPILKYVIGSGVNGKRLANLAIHFSALIVLTWILHHGYKNHYGEVMDCEPTYMRNEGQMRLGLLVPLVRPDHLEAVGVSASLLERVTIPMSDPRNRESHMWMEGGLWSELQREVGTDQAAKVARKIAARALRSDPFGLVRMGISTTLDYFDESIAESRMLDDLGVRLPDQTSLLMFDEALRISPLPAIGVGVSGWFGGARWWLTGCLFLSAPLAVMLLWRGQTRAEGYEARVVLAFALLGLVASQFLFSHIVSFRYLHPLPALALLGVALAAFSRGHRLASIPR